MDWPYPLSVLGLINDEWKALAYYYKHCTKTMFRLLHSYSVSLVDQQTHVQIIYRENKTKS